MPRDIETAENRAKVLAAMDTLARFANDENWYEVWAIMTSDEASDIDEDFWKRIAENDEEFEKYYSTFRKIVRSGLFFGF